MPKKEKKSYAKPAYEVEDVFEKMSLACKQMDPCKFSGAGEKCVGQGNMNLS